MVLKSLCIILPLIKKKNAPVSFATALLKKGTGQSKISSTQNNFMLIGNRHTVIIFPQHKLLFMKQHKPCHQSFSSSWRTIEKNTTGRLQRYDKIVNCFNTLQLILCLISNKNLPSHQWPETTGDVWEVTPPSIREMYTLRINQSIYHFNKHTTKEQTSFIWANCFLQPPMSS